MDRLEGAINALGLELMRVAESERTGSLLVLVIEDGDGMGQVAVFQNGVLEERPGPLVVLAAKAAEKARWFAISTIAAAISIPE